jgi:hypothetical protein
MKPLHSINELIFDLSFSTKRVALREQENIQKWVVDGLLVEVDQLFNQYSNTHKVLRFDQLIIDVGSISLQNYQEKISQVILSKLTSLISEQLLVVIPLENSALPTTEQDKDIVLVQFVEFLLAGYISRHNPVPVSSVHETLFAQIADRLDIRTLLRTFPDSAVIVKRLVQQFSQVYLAEILQKLCPAQFESVLAFVDVIEITDFSSATPVQKKNVLSLLWEQLLIYFIANKVSDNSLSSWVKPLFSKFSNTLRLTERQLLTLIDETSRQHYDQIHSDLITYLLADSIHIEDVSRGANRANVSVNDQYYGPSFERSVSKSATQQIEFLWTNVFANENLDFILEYWQKIRTDHSPVALKVITYFMSNIDRRKKLVNRLPDAYLIDFVFLMQPQLLQVLLSLINNAEKLYAVMEADNESSRASFGNLQTWKATLWNAVFNGLVDQGYSTLDPKKYWQYLIKELSAVNNQNFSVIEHQWLVILGNKVKQTVAHGKVAHEKVANGKNAKQNHNSKMDEDLRSTDEIENRAAIDNATTQVAGYLDLTLLNEAQVHQLVSHAIAGMNIIFLVTHWDVLKQNFPDVLLNNLRHYFNRLELRQDIVTKLPEALLLDTVELFNSDVYPIISVLIGNAEFLYRVNTEAYIYSAEAGGSRKTSFVEWKADIWQACFSVLFNRFSAQTSPYLLILHVLESLSNIYQFDVQVAAPQWLSICNDLLPVSALASFSEQKTVLLKFSELEGSADKKYNSELVLVDRYLFNFERSQKTLDILLRDLSISTQAVNRLYRHIEQNFTSLLSIQLSLNDWMALIQCYISMGNREEAADLLRLLKTKIEQQELAFDYCYQIFARLLKSNEDSYKAVIEDYNFVAKDGSLREYPALKAFEGISDERVVADQNVLDVERILIAKNIPVDRSTSSGESFSINEGAVINLVSVDSSEKSKGNIPHLLKFEQQQNLVELELQSDKELLNSLRNGSVRLDSLNLSSEKLKNIVVECVETNSLYLASFKIDLLASIHNHANQVADLHGFYTRVLRVLLAEQILDLEAIVNASNDADSLNVSTQQGIESLKTIPLENLHQPNNKKVLSVCEQLKSKSINIMQVNASEADLWCLLVAYIKSDKTIVNDFRNDMLAAFSSCGESLVDRNYYYRKIIAALVDGDIIDLENVSKSVETLSIPVVDVVEQSSFKLVAQAEVNDTISEQGRHDMKVDNRTQGVKRNFDLQDLIALLQNSSELTSSQIIDLQKIINIAFKGSGFSDEEWAGIFVVKNMAEKFICYVPGHILHQLFLRLRPQAYQDLDELARVVLGALVLLIPNLNTHKIHQAKWLCITELLFGLAHSFDENLLLQKLSYNLGAAAGIEDLQQLLNLVLRRRVLLRPIKSQQAHFSQEKILEAIKGNADSNALAAGLHINNVGLVLVAPYFPRLLSMLELVKDSEFLDLNAADRAVHLLQYIVTGQSQTVEYELVLNKILCGISTSIPISSGIEITEQEKTIVEQMLASIIQHWRVLGSTSVTGLRETFFQREGWLRLEDDAWHLDVKEGTFDMLIDHIPWSFSLIKYAWMDKPLHVKWRSKD